MLIRISLILAIIGGLAVAGVNFLTLKDNITKTLADRDNEKHQKEETQRRLSETNKVLVATTKELTKTKADLASTTQQRDEAVAQAADLTKKNTDLANNLKDTQQKLGTTSDKLAAWESLNLKIEEARTVLGSVRRLTEERDVVSDENKILYANNRKLKAKLDSILTPSDSGTPLPEGLAGKVLAVDPKYQFVVLNVGEKQGVLADGQMLVSHNGKLVAKLRITDDIKDDKCIANVMPGWKFSDVNEGDTVLLPY